MARITAAFLLVAVGVATLPSAEAGLSGRTHGLRAAPLSRRSESQQVYDLGSCIASCGLKFGGDPFYSTIWPSNNNSAPAQDQQPSESSSAPEASSTSVDQQQQQPTSAFADSSAASTPTDSSSYSSSQSETWSEQPSSSSEHYSEPTSSTVEQGPSGATENAQPTETSSWSDLQPTESSSSTESSAVPAPTQAEGNGLLGGLTGLVGQLVTGGHATYYYQNGVTGSCGTVSSDQDYVAAISSAFGDNKCGQQVRVLNKSNGKTVDVKIMDLCPTCLNAQSLDLSEAAFSALVDGNLAVGMVDIDYQFHA